jgi:hypothetical protein
MRKKWFEFLCWIDDRIVHPWWDKQPDDDKWYDEYLWRFCQYSQGGLWDEVWNDDHEYRI